LTVPVSDFVKSQERAEGHMMEEALTVHRFVLLKKKLRQVYEHPCAARLSLAFWFAVFDFAVLRCPHLHHSAKDVCV